MRKLTPEQQAKRDAQALDMLRRGRIGAEDQGYVMQALLHRIEALELLINELTEPVEEEPKPAKGKAA
jgi:hypothetical protein